jgi:hypothetical protein
VLAAIGAGDKMTVLKWVLVAFGVIFLIIVAVIVGSYFWAQNIEAVKLTAADVQPGGAYPPAEREALLAACQKQSKLAANATACTCIADKAGTEFSRFERLALTAGLEMSPRKVVALIKGLGETGVSHAEIDAIEARAKERTDAVLKSCGIAQR